MTYDAIHVREHISGPIAGVLSIGLAIAAPRYANDASASHALLKLGAYLTGGLSVLLLFFAQYDVWKTERDQLKAEKLKNEKPDIRGNASHFGCHESAHVEDRNGNKWSVAFNVKFRLELCNHSSVKTNVRRLLFDGSRVIPPVEMSEASVDFVDLNRGIGVTLEPITFVNIAARYVDLQQKEIDLTNLEITVFDGFHNRHLIKPLPGSALRIR
jgi:hypothetical protein